MNLEIKDDGSSCEESMFMSSETETLRKAAHLSCIAQHAFQRNWYPDPIQGKQDQIWSKAASQGQLATKLN